MKTRDLFNAINDIETKYVTDAWRDTEPEVDTAVIYESASKTSKAKIFGVAAAFAALLSAACLAVYIRVNELPNNNILTPGSASVSEIGADRGITGALPFELIGADGKQINYEDVSSATDKYGRKIELAELTADNWTFIYCKFAYLAEPGSDTFERYNVGDRICGYTIQDTEVCGFIVTQAEAHFCNGYGGNIAQKYIGSKARLSGVLETETYLAQYKGAYYCVNNALPTASYDYEEKKNGRFVPVTREPAFSVTEGFSTEDNEFGEPTLDVSLSLIKTIPSRILRGEPLPVTAWVDCMEIEYDNITASVQSFAYKNDFKE